MEAPPKLQFFEVARLLPEIRSNFPYADNRWVISPKHTCFRVALSELYPEHREYLTNANAARNTDPLEAMVALVVDEEWVNEVMNTLKEYDENLS